MTGGRLSFDIIIRQKDTIFSGVVPGLGIDVANKMSQGEVLDETLRKLTAMFNGSVFFPTGEMMLDATIATVKLEIGIRVRENRELCEFEEAQMTLEAVVPDEGFQVALEGDAPLQLPAAEGDTSDYLDSVVATIEGMQQRDPVVDSLFRSGYTDEDTRERAPTSIQPAGTANPHNTWALPVSNDVINGMYIVASSRTPINYVIMPNSGGMSKERGISVGDRVILYETAAKKGRKAYIGECVVDELHHVPRDKVCSTDWSLRLSFLYQDIAGAIGSGCSDVRIARVIDLKLYPDPLPVPQGSSIPHGLMGLTGWELAKIFNDKSVLDPEV